MPGVLLWGYDTTNNVWIPLQVDSTGRLKVDMSAINLNGLGDVSVPSPTGGHIFYYDAGTSLWKAQAVATNLLNLLTTRGDIIVRAAATVTRFGLGAQGKSLRAGTNDPEWSYPNKIQDADADTALEVEQSADEDKIHGKVKSVEALLIEDDGILTLAKQSGAAGYQSSNQSIPSVTRTKLNWGTLHYDIQGEFDLTNDKFTVTRAGIYFCAVQVQITELDDGEFVSAYIYKNGDYVISCAVQCPGDAKSPVPGTASFIQLAVDDYIEFYLNHNHPSARYTNSRVDRTFFGIAKVA